MPRLIDANKLRKDILDLPNCYNGFSDTYDKAMIIDLIDEQPTVDAVEVVRCKNCEYYLPDEPTICELTMCGASDEGFCAWAERKKDAKEE